MSRAVSRNFAFMAVSNVLAPMFSLVLVLAISRLQGVEALGKYSLLMSVFVFGMTVSGFGLPVVITREVAREHAVAAGLSNIEYVHCLADDPQLPAASADTIVIVNTFHHFADRRAYVAKLRKALLPGGRIVNIDFIPKPREQTQTSNDFVYSLVPAADDARLLAFIV